MTGSPKRPKHVPERTCIACKQKRAKWELVRIVRTVDGSLEIDPRGKKAGRGAYLCKLQECWEIGLKKKRLEYALKSQIAPEQRAGLLAFSKSLTNCVERPGVNSEVFCEGACG